MSIPSNEQAFINLIPEGEPNAISQHDLAELASCSTRDVKNRVNHINADYHIPIGATNAGYFRISSETEFEKVFRRRESQINSMRSQLQDLLYGWRSQQNKKDA